MKHLLLLLVLLSANTLWAFCDQSKMGGVPLPFSRQGKFMKDCVPEYLYSWQSSNVIKSAKSKPDGSLLISHKGYLYLFRTPLGTIGYGDAVVEIKVKKNVQWQFDDNQHYCNGDDSEKNMIYVHYRPDYGTTPVHWSEYIICHSNVIESWSFGTTEIKQKMETEYQYVLAQNNNIEKFDWFVSPHNTQFKCLDCWLGYYPWDTNKVGWLKQGYHDRLKLIEKMIAEQIGGIFASNEFKITEHNNFERNTYFLAGKVLDEENKIEIIDAKLTNVIKNLSLMNASRFCNKKASCYYTISDQFITDPAPGEAKDFYIKWTCNAYDAAQEIYVAKDASEKTIKLKCDKGDTIRVVEATYGKNLIPQEESYQIDLARDCNNQNPCTTKLQSNVELKAYKYLKAEVKYRCLKSKEEKKETFDLDKQGQIKIKLSC